MHTSIQPNENERLARLETKVDHMENDIKEIRQDIRGLRGDMSALNDKMYSLFKWVVGIMFGTFISILASLLPLFINHH